METLNQKEHIKLAQIHIEQLILMMHKLTSKKYSEEREKHLIEAVVFLLQKCHFETCEIKEKIENEITEE